MGFTKLYCSKIKKGKFWDSREDCYLNKSKIAEYFPVGKQLTTSICAFFSYHDAYGHYEHKGHNEYVKRQGWWYGPVFEIEVDDSIINSKPRKTKSHFDRFYDCEFTQTYSYIDISLLDIHQVNSVQLYKSRFGKQRVVIKYNTPIYKMGKARVIAPFQKKWVSTEGNWQKKVDAILIAYKTSVLTPSYYKQKKDELIAMVHENKPLHIVLLAIANIKSGILQAQNHSSDYPFYKLDKFYILLSFIEVHLSTILKYENQLSINIEDGNNAVFYDDIYEACRALNEEDFKPFCLQQSSIKIFHAIFELRLKKFNYEYVVKKHCKEFFEKYSDFFTNETIFYSIYSTFCGKRIDDRWAYAKSIFSVLVINLRQNCTIDVLIQSLEPLERSKQDQSLAPMLNAGIYQKKKYPIIHLLELLQNINHDTLQRRFNEFDLFLRRRRNATSFNGNEFAIVNSLFREIAHDDSPDISIEIDEDKIFQL